MMKPSSPFDVLLPYQRRWADDESRFKFGLMARQVGKDYMAAAEGIYDCLLANARGEKITWLIAAPSERQSMESLQKWKEWAESCKLAIKYQDEERVNPRNSQSVLKSTTITFVNGSRVIAVPGRPDTVRGFSANILLTEALFFEDFDRTWRAILPSITNPLSGGPKKCRLISTPNGVGGKGQELWAGNYRGTEARDQRSAISDQKPESGSGLTSDLWPLTSRQPSRWSCHRVDIHDAVREGLAVDVEELRAALDDPEGWAQEYELQFLDQSSVLLPYEIIAPCENPLATEAAPADFWSLTSDPCPIDLGIDFGRKRDLTVCWALATLGGAYKLTREVLALEKLPTNEQVEILRPRIRRARRVCFDYTGPGIGMGDYLVREFGEYAPERHLYGKIELCNFTNAFKVDVFSKLRMEFDRRTTGVPVSRAVREDLHSLQRVALAGGGVTYRATHTEDSHADRATALALAVRAASANHVPFAYETVHLRGREHPRVCTHRGILP